MVAKQRELCPILAWRLRERLIYGTKKEYLLSTLKLSHLLEVALELGNSNNRTVFLHFQPLSVELAANNRRKIWFAITR
jgi:hypothetical protein